MAAETAAGREPGGPQGPTDPHGFPLKLILQQLGEVRTDIRRVDDKVDRVRSEMLGIVK